MPLYDHHAETNLKGEGDFEEVKGKERTRVFDDIFEPRNGCSRAWLTSGSPTQWKI